MYYLVVTAAAARSAMRGVFDCIVNRKQITKIGVLLHLVKNIKVRNVVAFADNVIFSSICSYRGQIANERLLDLCLPQAVKIAISIRRQGLFIGKRKNDLGRTSYLKTFALTALIGLKIDPKDAMLSGHRMLDRAHIHSYKISLNSNHGNMLFVAGINHTRLKLGHFLTATHHWNTCIIYHSDKISAVLANIKLVIITHMYILQYVYFLPWQVLQFYYITFFQIIQL